MFLSFFSSFLDSSLAAHKWVPRDGAGTREGTLSVQARRGASRVVASGAAAGQLEQAIPLLPLLLMLVLLVAHERSGKSVPFVIVYDAEREISLLLRFCGHAHDTSGIIKNTNCVISGYASGDAHDPLVAIPRTPRFQPGIQLRQTQLSLEGGGVLVLLLAEGP